MKAPFLKCRFPLVYKRSGTSAFYLTPIANVCGWISKSKSLLKFLFKNAVISGLLTKIKCFRRIA